SLAARLVKSRGRTASAGTPMARARSSANAEGLSEKTPTSRAARRPSSIASLIACRLLPRPEARTAMRKATGIASADMHALAVGGRNDLADPAMGQRQALQFGLDRGHFALRYHQHEADAAIERAPHFHVGHRAFALQPVEHRRQH